MEETSDRKAAKEQNYNVRQADKAEKAWEEARNTLKGLKTKSETEHAETRDSDGATY